MSGRRFVAGVFLINFGISIYAFLSFQKASVSMRSLTGVSDMLGLTIIWQILTSLSAVLLASWVMMDDKRLKMLEVALKKRSNQTKKPALQ